MIRLSCLYIHPVKSMKSIRLSQVYAEDSNLLFNRYFMIINDQSRFIITLQYLKMLLFKSIIFENGIQIQMLDKQTATFLYINFINHLLQTKWWNYFTTFAELTKINQWQSPYFNSAIQLKWLSKILSRRTKKFPATPLSFSDGCPDLVINQVLFKVLQKEYPSDVKLEQFRGNLIITDTEVFAEDVWHIIQTDEVVFEFVKLSCSRYILTTVNINDGSQQATGKPLITLQNFHINEHKKINFGQNTIAQNSNLIRICDTVKIVTKKQPKQYKTVKSTKSQIINEEKETTLLIDVNGTEYLVNNQIVILEQLEKHGLKIPYSCRVGICGCCKIKLIVGKVIPLTKTAIKEDGVILSCSCIPKTNSKLLLT